MVQRRRNPLQNSCRRRVAAMIAHTRVESTAASCIGRPSYSLHTHPWRNFPQLASPDLPTCLTALILVRYNSAVESPIAFDPAAEPRKFPRGPLRRRCRPAPTRRGTRRPAASSVAGIASCCIKSTTPQEAPPN